MSQFYDQASLVMIPSGYKNGKVYSQKPLSADGELTFTRASDATRVNADGLIEKVRTNLLRQSNTFDTLWAVGNSTITGGQTDKDGGTNAWVIASTVIGAETRIRQSYTFTIGQHITLSCYMKAGTVNYGIVRTYAITGGGRVWFDLVNGTVGTENTGLTGRIQSAGGGWYRCSISGIIDTTGAIDIAPAPANNDYLADAIGETVYIQNAQLELSDFGATDYIPTTTAAVSVGPVSGLPRLDYSGGCPSLLLEPQRTNVVLWSEQMDNAAWAKLNSGAGASPIVTANHTISPDGTQNADRIQFSSSTATSSNFSLLNQGSLTIASTGTFTMYVKSLTSSTQNLLVYWGLGQGQVFQVTTQWTRITLSNLTSGTQGIVFGTRGGSGNYYNGGDATLDIAVWGAQLEAGSYATSYIPTLGSAVTRLADTAAKAGMHNGVFAGATSGTLFVDFTFQNEFLADALSWNSSASAAGRGYLYQTRMGMADGYAINLPLTPGVRQKCIWRLNTLSNATVFANGIKGNTANGNVWNDISNISIYGSRWNLEIHSILMFPTALTDQQCIELTTL